jgi:hypothetical protein
MNKLKTVEICRVEDSNKGPKLRCIDRDCYQFFLISAIRQPSLAC